MTTSPSLSPEKAAAQRAVLGRVAEVEAEESRIYAAKMRLRAEIDELWNGGRGLDEGPQVNGYFGVIELAGAARIGQTRATTQLSTGTRLVTVLTGTLAKLEAGEVYVETAKLLLELTRNCRAEVAAEVERRVLKPITGMTTTDARRVIEQTIPEVEADLDPELTEQRLDAAAAGSTVWTRDLPDGMAQIGANVDLVSARRWSADFEELVRGQVLADKRAGIKRTMDQTRALVFAQLPSRLLALVTAIQRGEIQPLLAMARIAPDLAEQLEQHAASTPTPVDDADGQLPFDVEPPVQDEPSTDFSSEYWAEWMACSPDGPHWPGAELCPPPWRLDPEAPPAATVLDELDPPPDDPEPPGDPEDEPPPPPDPQRPDAHDRPLHDAHRPGAWTAWSVRALVVHVLSQKLNDSKILNIHMPATTALELDNRTATLDGGGVLPARHARLLLPTTTLRRVFVDPDSHQPLGLDPTLHPPPEHPGTEHPQAERPPRAARHLPLDQQQLRDGLRARIRETFGVDWEELEHTPSEDNRPAGEKPNVAGPDGATGADVDGGADRVPAATLARLRPLMEPYLLEQRAERAHDPSTALRAFIELRDQRCTGIGCSHPARRCHKDHLIPYPDGPTAPWNLGAKSARCHRAKHAGWTITQELTGPDSGAITWTSPLGHSYTRPTVWARIPRAD